MNKLCGVYKIKNLVNGKIYVGSSVDIKPRWQQHRSSLRGNHHGNNYLQRSWNKYGESCFIFEIIREIENQNELIKHEQECIDTLLPQYNMALRAGLPMLGRKHSLETRRKMSKSQKGRILTPDHRLKISKAVSGKNNANTKLSKEKVIFARYLHEKCNVPRKKIKNYFGVSKTTIANIVRYKTWKYI